MDSLIKQMRKKSTSLPEKNVKISGGDKKIPARQSISFKEGWTEKKKSLSWFQKHFSRQMAGHGYDPTSELDHAAAVAAAAYAIASRVETWSEKQSGYELETVLKKPKNKREDVLPLQEPRRNLSRRASGKLSFKELLEREDGKSPEPKSPARKTPPAPRDIQRQGSTAEDWEKAELAKIKERYEKLNRTIDLWEAKKMTKMRRKLETLERKLEQKRKLGLQRFREDTDYITRISGGARSQAATRRRSQETKVKEKADVIRQTGELPPSPCLCF